jgi:pyruvate/2-oxoglutarate dehydrogenase complex dihydrolipoamide acyltransferase (E2) component
VLVDDASNVGAFKDFVMKESAGAGQSAPAAPETPPTPSQTVAAPAKTVTPSAKVSTGARQFISPLAKRLSQEMGLDVS